MKVVIYSDGGADPNPGVGGWAAIIRHGDREQILSGNEPWTTNNRMELQAAISAFQALAQPSRVEFHTDSEYLRKGITEWIDKWEAQGWQRKGKPIRNVDLWKALRSLVKRHEVNWYWVRSHAGDQLNERVDKIARKARLEITSGSRTDRLAPQLFVRGSCKGNPGPGGWGVVLERNNHTEQLSGSDPRTTNNRMELTAAIQGLTLLPSGSAVDIVTTSDYLFQGITRWITNWRQRNWTKRDGKPISNQDLWRQLNLLSGQYDIHWINAKGQGVNASLGLKEAGQLAASAIELEQD